MLRGLGDRAIKVLSLFILEEVTVWLCVARLHAADAEIKVLSADFPELSKYIQSFKPTVDQNIALHTSTTARNSALLISVVPFHSTSSNNNTNNNNNNNNSNNNNNDNNSNNNDDTFLSVESLYEQPT